MEVAIVGGEESMHSWHVGVDAHLREQALSTYAMKEFNSVTVLFCRWKQSSLELSMHVRVKVRDHSAAQKEAPGIPRALC